jgi:hypothetical protein
VSLSQDVPDSAFFVMPGFERYPENKVRRNRTQTSPPMHWSLKLASLAQITSLLVAIASGLPLIWDPHGPANELLGRILWSAVLIAFVSGFHVAVRDALKRLATPSRNPDAGA